MKEKMKMSEALEKKIAELEAVQACVENCIGRARWWCSEDDDGNVTFCDNRHEAMYNAFLALAEKLTKEYTK